MTALANDLTSLGMAPALASRVGITIKSITGVGTAQGGSSPKVYGGDVALLTTAGGATACTIDTSFAVGEEAAVYNISSTAGLLYPPSGCAIDGGSADASVAIGQNTGRVIVRVSPTAFRTIASGSAGQVGTFTSLAVSGAATIGTTLGVTGVVSAPSLALTATDTVTAFAGGGQASATQLTGSMANVTVVATAADSVKLPLATAGAIYLLRNSDAADSMQVFGAGTDTINAVATATGVAQAAGTSAVYFAITAAPAGKWFRVLSA